MIKASQLSVATPCKDETETPYPDLLHTLLWNAVMEDATDVHLHCVEGGVRVLHRVDGVVSPKIVLPGRDGRRLLNQLKSAAGITVAHTFSPVEGKIDWRDGDRTWEIRVTLTPVQGRQCAHLRFLSAPRDHWDLTNLGFSPAEREKVAGTIQSMNGLVLVTGPTGSGKTTTMYGLASLMDLRTTTTYSIEDPVEFRLPYAQQINVDERRGLTMYEGLRTILRMDPDQILIGEIRDADSAIVAARAALSGRLVIATIHARDAAGAVDALHYLGVPHHIIGSSLRLVIAQNLIRQLCGDCAQPRELDETETGLFRTFDMETPKSLLHAGSCETCNWYGYKGRTGIFEVATIDDELGAMICTGPHHGQLTKCLRDKGVRSIAYRGAEKVAQGVSSMEELFRVCRLPRRDASAAQQETVPGVVEVMAN